MSDIRIDPKFVDVAPGKRIVILEEKEFDRLLDQIDAKQVRKILDDETDKEIDWAEASGELVTNRIAQVRSGLGLSQRELAARLNIKPSTVSRWERKDANLTLETLRKVAAALDCDIHDLIS